MTARSSRNCLQATGHAFHWLSSFEQGTRGWPNDSRRLQTGQFGVALPFKLQKKGDPARPPRDAIRDLKMSELFFLGRHTTVSHCFWTSLSPPMPPLAKRCHVWLFGLLQPLVEMLWDCIAQTQAQSSPRLPACTHASEQMRGLRSNHGCFLSTNLPRPAVPLTNDLRSKQAPFGTIGVRTGACARFSGISRTRTRVERPPRDAKLVFRPWSTFRK